jgi:hypothetical protein
MKMKILVVLALAGILLVSGCTSNTDSTSTPTTQQADGSGNIGGNGGGSGGDNSAGVGNTGTESDKEQTVDGVTVKGLSVVNKDEQSIRPNAEVNTAYVKMYPKNTAGNEQDTYSISFFANKDDIAKITLVFDDITISNFKTEMVNSGEYRLYADIDNPKNELLDFSVTFSDGPKDVKSYQGAGLNQYKLHKSQKNAMVGYTEAKYFFIKITYQNLR